MVSLFILLYDRDCDRGGNQARAEARVSEHPGRLLACGAIQELEVWILAPWRDELGASWQEVRAHCDPKEAYAHPFLERKDWRRPGDFAGGYARAMRAMAGNWQGVFAVCEELRRLRDDIAAFFRR